MVKKVFKTIGILIGIVILLLVGLIAFLSITEFKPADREKVSANIFIDDSLAEKVQLNKPITVTTWNIGYCGLGKDSDFFMDGGKMVNPPSDEIIEKNIEGVSSYLKKQNSDIYILQEVDTKSSRTNNINQHDALAKGANSAFAYNYKCPFVPIPVPPMGRVESGISTISNLEMNSEGERVSLPCPFSWPVRVAQIKRCLLINRLPIENSDKELVVVNLHLEAYDDGEGKIAQTKLLIKTLEEEYKKGNYVVAGGDFNQSFPGALDKYSIKDTEKWTPGTLENDILPEGWKFAFDINNPTCRLLDAPYSGENQLYLIDGFIVSPNVEIKSVKGDNLNFEHSDHNPVTLELVCSAN
ncbi:MAG: endonuclease [Clostridia bacterium]|nr:endonuclease [Clostridia bacterium]